MPIIINTVLYIVISLSNGGIVTFEIDNNFFAKRIKFVDEDSNEPIDVLEIEYCQKDQIYEIDLIKDSLKIATSYSSRNNISDNVGSYDDIKFDFVGNYNSTLLTKKLLGNMHAVKYFIEINEIVEFVNCYSNLEVLDKNQLHVLTWFYVENPNNSIHPVDVNIQVQSSFSDLVLNKIEIIEKEIDANH